MPIADYTIDATARPVGQAPATVNKRVGDSRAYYVDCAPLLKRWELMARARVLNQVPGGIMARARPMLGGTVLEVHLSGGPAPEGRRPLPVPLHIAIVTSQGSIELALSVLMHE
jgi:hypothetical protein